MCKWPFETESSPRSTYSLDGNTSVTAIIKTFYKCNLWQNCSKWLCIIYTVDTCCHGDVASEWGMNQGISLRELRLKETPANRKCGRNYQHVQISLSEFPKRRGMMIVAHGKWCIIVEKLQKKLRPVTGQCPRWAAALNRPRKHHLKVDKRKICDGLRLKKKKRNKFLLLRLEKVPWGHSKAGSARVTSCILLKTCVRALWLSRWRTPRRSWWPLSGLPAPGCEARRWSFRPGCTPLPAAEPDASPNRTRPSQRPDRRHQNQAGNVSLERELRRAKRQAETDQDGLSRDAVSQSARHSHLYRPLRQSLRKQVHLWRAVTRQPAGPPPGAEITSQPDEDHPLVTHESDPAPTYPGVDIDPRLGSLLHQPAAVQQGAEQRAVLGLCVGSAREQQSPFLNQAGQVGHHPDDHRVLR